MFQDRCAVTAVITSRSPSPRGAGPVSRPLRGHRGHHTAASPSFWGRSVSRPLRGHRGHHMYGEHTCDDCGFKTAARSPRSSPSHHQSLRRPPPRFKTAARSPRSSPWATSRCRTGTCFKTAARSPRSSQEGVLWVASSTFQDRCAVTAVITIVEAKSEDNYVSRPLRGHRGHHTAMSSARRSSRFQDRCAVTAVITGLAAPQGQPAGGFKTAARSPRSSPFPERLRSASAGFKTAARSPRSSRSVRDLHGRERGFQDRCAVTAVITSGELAGVLVAAGVSRPLRGHRGHHTLWVIGNGRRAAFQDRCAVTAVITRRTTTAVTPRVSRPLRGHRGHHF